MRLMFEDLTHQAIEYDKPIYPIFDGMVFLFFLASFASGLNWFWLAIERKEEIGYVLHPIVLSGIAWMLAKTGWIAFCFPKRVHFIYLSEESDELIISRDCPCGEIALPKGGGLTYNVIRGNFAMDMNQRGDAPVGLNFWFESQGKQFWLSEASPNYREVLYLLCEHANLRHDPTLHRWEHKVFWYRWREHFKQRPGLPEIIDEVHRILAGEQRRPDIPPAVTEAVSVGSEPELAPEPTLVDAPARAEETIQPAALVLDATPSEYELTGGTRAEIKEGRATLIISRPRQ